MLNEIPSRRQRLRVASSIQETAVTSFIPTSCGIRAARNQPDIMIDNRIQRLFDFKSLQGLERADRSQNKETVSISYRCASTKAFRMV
jgi:hypothetical protein